MADFMGLMKQAAEFQSKMQDLQNELDRIEVEGTAGGGMVKVVATGAGEIKEIVIDPKAIDPDDPELLADMVTAAVNEALRSSQSLLETKLGPALGGLHGLGLPGL